MAEKKYQVFVSSTYADLQDERAEVMQTIFKANCIPAGMEIFPAVDESQLEFIKSIIDDCDYYIIIIGGRYGSVTRSGLSYTESEFDYAAEKGKKILAFIHEDPSEIAAGKSELDEEARDKLEKFREKVKEQRIVQFWKHSSELPGKVALSLIDAIRRHPAVGWVRGDAIANAEVLEEINSIRKENIDLKNRISKYENKSYPKIENIAGLDEDFLIEYKFSSYSGESGIRHTIKTKWRKIFAFIGPKLEESPSQEAIKTVMASFLEKYSSASGFGYRIEDESLETIRVQFAALGLINPEYAQATTGLMAMFWKPTPKGISTMFSLRAIRSSETEAE